MDLHLRSLRHALTLAQHRHYGRAAGALNISQSALSRSIAALEATLGVQLFERGRSGIRLTPSGEVLVARGAGVVNGAADITREISMLQGLEVGELRVGAGLYPAAISVGTALGQLSIGRPGLRVSLMAEQWRRVTAAVRAGEVDVAVVESSTLEKDSRVTIEPLEPHAAAFVCRRGHALLKNPAPAIEAILSHPLVGPILPPRVGSLLSGISPEQQFDAAGNIIPAFHVESTQVTVQILIAGDAVAVLPLLLIESELEAGSLVVINYRAPWMRTEYGFAWPSEGSLSAAALAFMAEVRALEALQVKKSAALARSWLKVRTRRR